MTTRPALLLVALCGCVGSPGLPPAADETSSTEATPTATDSGGPETGTSAQTSTGSTSSVADTSTTLDPDTTGDSTHPFIFIDEDPSDYVQVDRAGFPGVNTLLNLLGDEDAYNAGTPADDAAGAYSSNIRESFETIHLGAPGAQTPDNTGLDDDLLGLALDPCVTPPLPMNNCDDQTEPFVIPDVITINANADSGFPNGRRLADPVMDIILAVVLIDLGPMLQGLTTFTDLDQDGTPGPSLNPLANDVEFQASFPYLAHAH